MNSNENLKAHMTAWPRRLASVMEIHRQRFSQLNQKYKQKPIVNPSQSISSAHMYPIILPQASRPQPRQQARTKQQFQPTQRSNTAHVRNQTQSFLPNSQYITLANLTKVLHVLQTHEKINDNDTATEVSASTINSAKQRGQQHLQQTATRWWKPTRLPDSYSTPSTEHSIVLQQPSNHNKQLQENLPLLTVVSNSTQQLNIPSTNENRNSNYDESESSGEIQPITVRTPFMFPPKSVNHQRTRQEPLIMQARGMRIQSYDHRYYTNHNNMNFFQQQRLIRQT